MSFIYLINCLLENIGINDDYKAIYDHPGQGLSNILTSTLQFAKRGKQKIIEVISERRGEKWFRRLADWVSLTVVDPFQFMQKYFALHFIISKSQ